MEPDHTKVCDTKQQLHLLADAFGHYLATSGHEGTDRAYRQYAQLFKKACGCEVCRANEVLEELGG